MVESIQNKLFLTLSFDDLLGGGLKSGNIYDLCGLSASGKTQLCHSIAINLAIQYKYETLYVDAKNDFSGQRIYNTLSARNCSDVDCGVIMNCIRCQPIYDVHEFLNILRGLPAYLKEHKQTKCLVLDSLPALWFPLMDGKKNGKTHAKKNTLCQSVHQNSSFSGLSLLSEATNLMQKIAFSHDMIFLLVNIVTRRTETDGKAICSVQLLPGSADDLNINFQTQLDVIKPRPPLHWANIGRQYHGKDFF